MLGEYTGKANNIWGAGIIWLRGIGSDPLPDADNAAVGSIGYDRIG